MHLSVTAVSTGTVVRDGHTIPVTYWDGEYGAENHAHGAVINEGILAGLIAEVTRNATIDLDDGGTLEFGETQSLARVLSPSIITESENTPPSIESVVIREGTITNEGASIAHLEVTVDDPDWNVRSVTADLSALSLGVVTLNDIGLDGDTSVHDETYTISIEYTGTIDGEISIQIEVEDDWTSLSESHTITILNRLPQISALSFTPINVNRGEMTSVVVSASDGSGVTAVGIDTTQWGGNVTWLSQFDGNWVGDISVPENIPSGDQILPVRLEDGAGGNGSTTKFGTGEDLTALHILNEGPTISEVTFSDGDDIVDSLGIPALGVNEYTLTARVTDYDTVTIVQAKLGSIAPPGQSNNWISMRDDGQGPDAVAGDGIWSITVEVRPGVSGGTTQFEIRGIDQQLAQTPLNERTHEIELGNSGDGSGGGQAVLETASSTWIIVGIISLIILVSLVGLTFWIRGGGLKQMMLPSEDPWK
jgi:hypothetical protein